MSMAMPVGARKPLTTESLLSGRAAEELAKQRNSWLAFKLASGGSGLFCTDLDQAVS
jgi:hypothetical protein